MTREKREKTKIKRRSAGLVITPPAPRPIEADHPARLLFREAIASAKNLADIVDATGALSSVEAEANIADGARSSEGALQKAPVPVITAQPSAPLQIFGEIRSAATGLSPPLRDAELPRKLAAEKPDRPPIAVEKPVAIVTSKQFEKHFGQWRPFLPEGQLYILEALFNLTHAVGGEQCMSSMPKLAAAAGISERQTYNVVKELERLGFVERLVTFNTRAKKGTIFRLNLSRNSLDPASGERQRGED